MGITERITDLVEPLLGPLDLVLYDVEYNGGLLRVTVDGQDPSSPTAESDPERSASLERVAELTRQLSHTLDEADPMPGAYTLEVSSPGLERKLRTPAHFAGAVGETVSLKLGPQVEGNRRTKGQLLAFDDAQLTLLTDSGEERQVDVDDITRATTVFEWGPAPKPGSPEAKKQRTAKKKAAGSDDAKRRASAR